MNTLKTSGGSLLLILLLASNLGMIVERLIWVETDRTQSNIAGIILDAPKADFGEGMVTISVDKMNVFYIGIDNPITVVASGVKKAQLKLIPGDGLAIRKNNDTGQYMVTCSKLGIGTITVKNKITGKTKSFEFRIKQIPEPIVRLGGRKDGLMGSEEFRAEPGLTVGENLLGGNCKIESYTLYYTCKNCSPTELQGEGTEFIGDILDLIRRADSGDQYAFTNVRVRCSGDAIARRVNGLAFKIK